MYTDLLLFNLRVTLVSYYRLAVLNFVIKGALFVVPFMRELNVFVVSGTFQSVVPLKTQNHLVRLFNFFVFHTNIIKSMLSLLYL